MREATIIDFAGQSTEHSGYTVEGALVGVAIRRTLQQNNSALELLNLARTDASLVATPEVKKAANRLSYNIDKTRRGIEYQLHQRAALATCCLFTLMLGAVLSMKMRYAMPLVVYFWTFLLTIVALIVTHSGENVMTDRAYDMRVGLVVVWLGAALLGGVVMAIYWKLMKN
jgi:lipopolysaccharide export LptBFGC system permease protein LptF